MSLRNALAPLRRNAAFALVLALGLAAVTTPPARAARGVAAAMDSLLTASYRPDEPGAAVIVVKDGKTILRKGYGLADLELGVRIEPDMIFRLGSVTKQFTAVAVLMLAEEGKLALDDPITKFLPGYPTHGQTITIEHLLTHTSGIKSYTELPEWLKLWRQDLSLGELIALFKDQPPDFAPGAKWSYSNSGYILLGAVIEKVSGMSYADFVRKRLFEPLGMKHTMVGSTERVIQRRVPGYSKTTDGFLNAAYLSMTQPYAAGSLISSVDDLALWDAALYGERLVKRSSLERAWTPYVLASGDTTGYGYGWMMTTVQGHPCVEHGGGINGFATAVMRLPQDHVYVAVLSNRDAGPPAPSDVALRLAALAIGSPYRDPVAVKLAPGQLEPLTGVYQLGPNERRVITREGDRLFSQRSGGEKREIFALAADEFFFKGTETRLSFVRDAAGKVTAVRARARYGPAEVAPRTDLPIPMERTAIALDPVICDRYVGHYELAPGFVMEIARDGDHLFAQATGQDRVEIFPEAETKFFLKVVDARIEFVKDAAGKVTSLTLHQGGQDIIGRRME
mgnify:FL=1